jgi:hypothetical protein
MVELQIVILAVAGSSPVGRPISLLKSTLNTPQALKQKTRFKRVFCFYNFNQSQLAKAAGISKATLPR